MSTMLIRDHRWRPFRSGSTPRHATPGACAFMSCRRQRADHERAVTWRWKP